MSDILTHIDHGIATITLNRVDKKNAFTAAMYADMARFMEQVAQEDGVRVLVFQGHPTVFSAGNDIADFLHHPPSTPEAPVFRFLEQISTFPKPVVAAVAGPAVGIGTTMLLHCDLVYAGDNAAFSMPFVNLGLCPEAACSLLAPLRMGHARASEALLLGEPFLADAALEMGVVNRIVAPVEVNAYAQAQAARLAAKPLSSLIETKRLLKADLQPAIAARMAEEATVFARMLREPAAREAFAAFMGKRPPQFH